MKLIIIKESTAYKFKNAVQRFLNKQEPYNVTDVQYVIDGLTGKKKQYHAFISCRKAPIIPEPLKAIRR